MSNYLTTSNATTTYQLKSDMINYVNTSNTQIIKGLKKFRTLSECTIYPKS